MKNTNHSHREWYYLISPITDISETHYYNKRHPLQKIMKSEKQLYTYMAI